MDSTVSIASNPKQLLRRPLVVDNRQRPPHPLADESTVLLFYRHSVQVVVGTFPSNYPVIEMFTTLGRNQLVEARPAVMHFAGFELGKMRTMKLKIINISSKKQRVHVINPTTPFFIVRYNKLGNIAPGMAETLYVDFHPKEWRYYYDCVRLHTPDDSLLVPIHAYPTMYDGDNLFPKIIDFGVLAVGRTSRRTIPLRCTVPIDFEYEITVVEGHTAFSVYPLKGVVPANGQADVTVEYKPSSQLTCQSRIRLNVSQFDFKPVDCLLLGSASAIAQSKPVDSQSKFRPKSAQSGFGKEMDSIAMDLTSALPASCFPSGESPSDDVNKDYEDYDEPLDIMNQTETSLDKSLIKLASLSLHQGKGGQTATADAVEAIFRAERNKKLLQQRGKKVTKKIDNRMTPDKGVVVDGYRLPPMSDLNTTRAVSDVLMQQPGKMRIRELKKAIAERKALQKARQTETTSEDTGDFDLTARHQVKELSFEQQLRRVEKFERNKDMKWFECLGEDLATIDDLKRISENRQAMMTRLQHTQHSDEFNRSTTICESRSSTRPLRPRDAPPLLLPSGGVYKPTFSDLRNCNPWLSRGSALEMFRKSACKVIARTRAAKRLQLIGQFLNAVNRDSDAIQSVVVQQAAEQALEAAGAAGAGSVPGAGEGSKRGDSNEAMQGAPPDICDDSSLLDFDISRVLASTAPDSIILSRFPLYREHDFRENVRVDVPDLIDFEDWAPLPLKVPKQFKSMDYPLNVLPAPPEARLPGDASYRSMRGGAVQEFGNSGVHETTAQTTATCPSLPPDIDLTIDPSPSHIFAPLSLPLSSNDGGGRRSINKNRETGLSKGLFAVGNGPRAPPAAKSESVGIGSELSVEGLPSFSKVYKGQAETSHITYQNCEKVLSKKSGVPITLNGARNGDLEHAVDLDAEDSGVVCGVVKDFSGITPRMVPIEEMCPQPSTELIELEFNFTQQELKKQTKTGKSGYSNTMREIAFKKMSVSTSKKRSVDVEKVSSAKRALMNT